MLSLHISEIITAIIYLGLLISIGITFRTFSSDADDYLRAGCRGTWWLVGASTFMASFTAMTFVAISGLGESAAWDLMEGRQGKTFLSIEEVALACPKVSKTHIQMLKDAGAFGSLPDTSQVSFF